MRALFGTASFEDLAGSELVVLELAESLVAHGHECAIAAFNFGQPMRRLAKKAGVQILPRVADVKPLQFDLVWFQTQVGAAMDFGCSAGLAERTLLAFAHLDLTWDFAGPGPVLEDAVADRFMFPSPEAATHFALQGLDGARSHVFHNAAPAAYSRPSSAPRQKLRKLLLVSNHLPAEIGEAAVLLRAGGIDVQRWGRAGDVRDTRLLPEHLDDADAVVSIGKTIQYALRSRVPVFVYDHFGGPGWLSKDNFDRCAYANFSGRCCRRIASAEIIADEIATGFAEAAQTAATWTEQKLAPYRLEMQVRALLAAVEEAPTADTRAATLGAVSRPLARERSLVTATGRYFSREKKRQRDDRRGTGEQVELY